jgi:hypothetical protein
MKTEKCRYLREEIGVTKCTVDDSRIKLDCPKNRSQYRVTAVCWKVPVNDTP